MESPAPAPAAPNPPPRASALHRFGRIPARAIRGIGRPGLWLAGALVALLLAAVLALWLWAATPGSLGQTLGWAQAWMKERAGTLGQLDTEGVEGSLHEGGHIARLQWSFNGLNVQAHGLRLRWNTGLWTGLLLGRGVHLQEVGIERLEVRDGREPKPSEVLQSLTLPLPVSLAWSVGSFSLEGPNRLALGDIKGHYRYGPASPDLQTALGNRPAVADAHQLTLDSLRFAQGRYRLQASMGAQAPMPLVLNARGEVLTTVPEGLTLTLQATASATGTLAGASATLDLTADVRPGTASSGGTPTLAATARVMPWAPHPLLSVDATAHRLDLATLWPQAPATLLTGTLRALPAGDAWMAEVHLDNAASGPWDQQRLPLQSLQAGLEQRGARWLLPHLSAKAGRGQIDATGEFQPASASEPARWQGQLKASGVNPALLWSTLVPATLDARLSARTAPTTPTSGPGAAAIDLDARILPSASQPATRAQQGLQLRELALKGQWVPAPAGSPGGALTFSRAVLDAAQARLAGQGRVDVTASTFAGSVTLMLPGARGSFEGTLAHADGRGKLALQVDEAAPLLDWLRGLQRLPVMEPPVTAWMQQQPVLRDLLLTGRARLSAQWQGGLAELGYPAPRASGTPARRVPLQLKATLDIPRLDGSVAALRSAAASPEPPSQGNPANAPSTAPTARALAIPPNPPPNAAWAVRNLHLQTSGTLTRLALQLQGEVAQGTWRALLDAHGQLLNAWPLPGSANAPHAPASQLALNTLRLQASDASRPDRVVDWSLRNTGPLSLGWRATATGLDVTAEPGQVDVQPNVRLLPRSSAATAAAGTGGRSAPPLTGSPATLAWDSLAWQAGTLQSKGRLRGLPLAWVDALATAEGAISGPITQAGVTGDLVFDGDWDLMLPAQAGTPLRLSARLIRSSGDLLVQTDGSLGDNGHAVTPARAASQRLQAGVREASLNLSAQGNTVQARLRWDSERLGQASADLGTELSLGAAGTGPLLDRWWPASAPLRGTLSAQLPQVGVWSALAPPGWRMRGTLKANATLGGTRGSPRWNGTLQADQLALRSVVEGFSFGNGQLRATLAGDRLSIDRFYLEGPRGAEVGGTLEATGTAQWRAVEGQGPRQAFIDLQATASKLRVSSRADRRLTISGQASAQLAGPRLTIRGRLSADSALFILPDELAPTLGADVVVRGGRSLPGGTATAQVEPDVSVDLDLGSQFDVRGRGLQTRLGGQLTVRSTPALPTPRVLGEVRAVNGTYRAYGQQLAIETGVLRFTGPYDDPTLDIVAIRPQARDATQRVGVQISGTAQVPRVRLISTPELPDSEKLAWLVLGRPATGAGAEAAVLQQAALALLAGNDGALGGGLAGALGLDELSYQGEITGADGTTTAGAVTLGKRLSSQLYVSYERSLAGAMGTVSIFYDISRLLTLRARAGEENALDLIFTVQYD